MTCRNRWSHTLSRSFTELSFYLLLYSLFPQSIKKFFEYDFEKKNKKTFKFYEVDKKKLMCLNLPLRDSKLFSFKGLLSEKFQAPVQSNQNTNHSQY